MKPNVTYLLGAGASFGNRETNGCIIRGVPIVSELDMAIKQVVNILKSKSLDIDQESLNSIIADLTWLLNNCNSYPTIDTYAKMLYVTGKDSEYNKLKRTLSIFFLLEQLYFKHDQRYDSFIASLLDENKKFPPINILTWNYDIQFELAYSDYSSRGKYITYLWDELNVICKTRETEENMKKDFSIIKLNGIALFANISGKNIVDLFNGGYKNDETISEVDKISKQYIYRNFLSYSWEKNPTFMSRNLDRISETTSLVIIGYSFPYVNREIDRQIIQSMGSLKRIYIQDPNASEIRENIDAILTDEQKRSVEYIFKDKSLRQFFIPNDLC